jgi:outer membrane biosynthesis protein TonB
MDRAQATGFGISATGHLALIVILSLGFAASRLPPPRPAPIEVSFVKDVGLVSAAPVPSPAPPAQSVAPEAGPPEEAAPAPIAAPRPPEPIPTPVPPKPAPRLAETPAPARPAPKKPATPAPAATRAAPAAVHPAATPRSGTATASRGSHLGFDFLKGIGSEPSPSRSQQNQAAAISAEALASIQAAIQRQIQPCANRQVNPGPGADTIRVKLHLRLNRDGSLAQTPRVVGTSGVSGENSRYEDRVKDLAIAAYIGCSPLQGLPAELYQTPKGGWGDINMNYKLP